MRKLWLAFSICLLAPIGIPHPGFADERGAAENEESETPEGREQWRATLLAANREVARAEQRHTEAIRAYERMRHRRRPRGEGKRLIMQELEAAREDLANAQRELAHTEKAARRAGAPPSWLRFDPAELEAPAPASPDS